MSELPIPGEATEFEALGWLVVGLINDHFPHPDEPDPDEDEVLGTSGCVVNCGPCGALKWFADNARDHLEDYVRVTGYHVGGWCYWNDESSRLRWEWFESYWARHKGCSSSDGVVSGCDYDEDDDDGSEVESENES